MSHKIGKQSTGSTSAGSARANRHTAAQGHGGAKHAPKPGSKAAVKARHNANRK